MATFYAARSEVITPLPWLTFALPFSYSLDLVIYCLFLGYEFVLDLSGRIGRHLIFGKSMGSRPLKDCSFPPDRQAARLAAWTTRVSGMKPADLAAAAKARLATPTGTTQSMAASTCFRAFKRASSATGHCFSNQYFTCSIVLNFCTSPSEDRTKVRGCPQ